MAQTGSRLIDQASTSELNRTVLQRIDHNIEEILFTAGHVTLYEFDLDEGQWSRKDVEGSLFVVKRRTKPRFQFIVMNRRSTENLVEDLLDDFEYELRVPYLLYHNAAQEVNGIWFYNSRECEEVANLFSRISNAYSKTPPKGKVFSPPQGDEFQELEAVPTPATVEGPLEPQAPPSSAETALEKAIFERYCSVFSNTDTWHASAPECVSMAGRKMDAAIRSSPVFTSTVGGTMPSVNPVLTRPPPPPPPPAPLSTTQPGGGPEFGSTKSTEIPLKPNFYVPPPLSSSQPTTLRPPPSLQPSVGAPLLQPFPPPVPSPSLALPPYKPAISRDGVRDALFRLVQNDNFIDLVLEEMLKAHRLPA